MNTLSSHTRSLPLHAEHAKCGAKFGVFGEWEVPLYYTSILEEHEAVRNRAGLFDVSHMGGFWIEGPDSEIFLNQLLPRRIEKVVSGQALYNPLLNEHGGFVDDIILYRFSQDRFYLIVNAGNVAKDFQWVCDHVSGDVRCQNVSGQNGLLSIQGPASARIVERVFGCDAAGIRYYRFMPWKTGMIARTGYTGEDGFEVVIPREELSGIWTKLLTTGASEGLVPAGFGARDTLRFEAAMPLYGHDMDDSVTPLEAGLNWAVDLTKDSFVGREALIHQKKLGVPKTLVGFEMVDRGIPRQGYEIIQGGKKIGRVTSGSFSPTLKKNFGLGYVSASQTESGPEIEIVIREKGVRAKKVPLPFYRRKK